MSQGSWQVPTGGSESAVTYAGQCNTAWLALASMNSGASAPANGPSNAPVQFQAWADMTSATQVVDRVYDGVNWQRRGTFDITNSIYQPQLGGGSGSVVAAATVDLGAQPQAAVTITGTTTITSFGASAKTGEMKLVTAGGAFAITNGANLACPGGVSIQTVVGDKFLAFYEGASLWTIFAFQRSGAGVGLALPTGATFWRYGIGAIAGAARCNANTIGNTGSGATEGTGQAYFNLYVLLWAAAALDAEIVISGGAGASAAADWAALKTITLVDLRGRVPGGLDRMGNSVGVAGRLTAAFFANPDVLGSAAGSQSVTLTTATIPAHTHTFTSGLQSADHTHTQQGTFASSSSSFVFTGSPGTLIGTGGVNANSGAVSTTISGQTGSVSANHSHSGTTDGTGSGGAHSNLQPTKLGTWYICL